MTTAKNLGIWMDHSSANIMEFSRNPTMTHTIDSKFTHQEKVDSLNKSEKLMHNKEQHQQAEYYKELGEFIVKYDKVILFGPTNAKVELFNILKQDHRFANTIIELEKTDKMTLTEQHSFVRDYFQKV